jgi:hypothetical protein
MFCPLRAQNLSTDCVGSDCMWYIYAQEKCAMLVLAENSKPVKNVKIDIGKYDGSDL